MNNKYFKINFSIMFLFLLLTSISNVVAASDGSSNITMSSMNLSLFDLINQILYPLTVIIALFTFWVCIKLIKVTGMKDKFGLIATGLLFFIFQSVFGVLYYVTTPHGMLISMSTVMFTLTLCSGAGLLLIGFAFYKWQKMIS